MQTGKRKCDQNKSTRCLGNNNKLLTAIVVEITASTTISLLIAVFPSNASVAADSNPPTLKARTSCRCLKRNSKKGVTTRTSERLAI